MEGIIIHGISKEELNQLLLLPELLDRNFSKLEERLNSESNTLKFHSRETTANILHISLPTLHEYTQSGKIRAKRIGKRVLYHETDILNALEEINHDS